MAKVNGVKIDISGMSIAEYLDAARYDVNRVVIKRNTQVIPTEKYTTTYITEEDEIEITRSTAGSR